MSDLVRAIIIMSLSGSVLAILLFILKPLVRNRLLKTAQYYLWLVVILALLVPVSQMTVLSGSQAIVPIPAIPAMPTISETVTRFVITQEEEFERLQSIAHIANTNMPAYLQQSQAIQSPLAFVTTYFVLIYPFGVLLLGLYYVINYLIFAGLYRRRNRPVSAKARSILANICKRRVPKLYCNPLAATPMLLGMFRPVIILPDQDYSLAQLNAILAHEVMHLRRKDTFVKWLMLIASTLHWFNPIMWLVRREIDRACELSCDEAVIRNLDIDGKQNYGHTLIAVSATSKTPRAVASVTMCEEKKNLRERLGAIMKSKKHTHIAVILSVFLILLAVSAVLILGIGNRNGNENGGSADNVIVADEPTYLLGFADIPTEIEAASPTPLSIYIVRRSDEFLVNFPTIHDFDFLAAYSEYWGLDDDHHFFSIEGDWGVVIWADVSMRDVQAIIIGYDDFEHESIPFVSGSFHAFNEILPGEPLLLSSFITVGGVVPREGISFVDPAGVRRYFAIADNRRDDNPPYFLMEFIPGSNWAVTRYAEEQPIVSENEPPQSGYAQAGEIPDYITIQGTRFSTSLTEIPQFELMADLTQEDLEQFRYMVNLTHLGFFSTQVTDLSPLAGLTNLRGLGIGESPVSDLSPIAGLNLISFSGSNNRISDLSPLANMNLEFLHLENNFITDISPLANSTNMSEMSLNGNQISDISVLANMTNLTILSLGMDFGIDWGWDSGPNGNRISDISPLAGLTNLVFLYLDSNQISDLSPLANLTNLTRLEFRNNQVSNLAPLAGLTNLEVLFAGSNQISDLTPLSNLPNIGAIFAPNNQIRDLSPLSGLTHLSGINFNHNQISDLSPLTGISNLVDIRLRSNQISDLTPLLNMMPEMQVLHLADNQISDVSPLMYATSQPAVLWLLLQENPITDWSPLDHVVSVGGRPFGDYTMWPYW